MKRKLKTARRVPALASDQEAAEFVDTHDTSAIWAQLRPAKPIRMPATQARRIRERHARRKAAISIRLDPGHIAAARKIAARKSIGYQTQLRMWIAEAIERETQPHS